MHIEYNNEKINPLLQDFHNVTGINLVLLRDDFTYVTNHNICKNNAYCAAIKAAGFRPNCFRSDRILLEKCKTSKRPEIHICHAGLVEIAVPILHNGVPISYILMGQMKPSADFAAAEPYIRNLGLNPKNYASAYSTLLLFDSCRIESLCNIAGILVNHILTENLLNQNYDDKLTRAIAYIRENLSKDLSVQDISKEVNVSKSVLYKQFHRYYGCTVSEYINQLRVEKSTALLTHTNFSIEDISQQCGFLSAAYYSKVFKRLKNTTPLKYRREHSRNT